MMRVCVLVAVLAGCYDPHPQAGSPCTSAGTCPRPLSCVNDVCVASVDDAAPPMVDADPTCACTGGTLTCAGGSTPCSLGCVAATPAHCARIIPSNGLEPAWADPLTTSIVLGGSVTINSDTGAITGSFTRGPGTGVIAGIDFHNHAFGTTPIGVFVFHALSVPGDVTLTGTQAIAFLVGTNATIAGTLDGSGGCGAIQACAGPGGQRGAKIGDVITGCGGGFGASAANGADGGGGGGGNGSVGGTGGNGGTTPGGVAGVTTCSMPSLEPLVGGGGGGPGGKGTTTGATYGGGGGGALQITALGTLTLKGAVSMGGGGGEGGALASNAAAGAGGGAGGSVIIEAANVSFVGDISANGGGGGGGGEGNAGVAGHRGENGLSGTQPAAGGLAGAAPAGGGGPGAAGAQPAAAGVAGGDTTNGGGGGGGAGRIVIREPMPAVGSGGASPAPQLIVITTN